MNRTLDYSPRYDERSRNYAVSDLVSAQSRQYKYWHPPKTILDQGSEGACVGFAWTNVLMCKPISFKSRFANQQAFGMYNYARFIDEWEGENYDGTSILAGAKVAQRMGFISQYRWCFNASEVLDALIGVGPVVLGIPWYEGMYDTLSNGLVDISGPMVGGHAICIYAYHPNRNLAGTRPTEVVYWRNSWGPIYGRAGTGYLRVSDLAELLSQGEACLPIY